MEDASDQEDMYRIQVLQAFDLNEWNNDTIKDIVNDLYTKLKDTPAMKQIFDRARRNSNVIEMLALFDDDERVEENDIILYFLFNFEYFDLLHRCIVDYFANNTIHEKYVTNLLNAL
jgi:hypothetical protein